MPDLAVTSPTLIPIVDTGLPDRIVASAISYTGAVTTPIGFARWFTDAQHRNRMSVRTTPLTRLDGWRIDPDTGNIGHRSGRFFTVEGLDIRLPTGPVQHWTQPIINQPEVGILGILVKEFDGVLHCLMQAKVEPGNRNGVQLSPTVQATRSNYTRVHDGKIVPYLEYFRDPARRHRTITDVRQSEQGTWFHQKRNRNMIVEVTEDVEVLPGFCWLTIGQVHDLLQRPDTINMDARTVLSCLPFTGSTPLAGYSLAGKDFLQSLVRSWAENHGSVHTTSEILSWITDARTRHELEVRRIPLSEVRHWVRTDARIEHATGRFFSVIGVSVEAGDREVQSWMQPMLRPHDIGVVAFLVRQIGGVLHALVHAGVEPGHLDVIELAPTVQCAPANYASLPPKARPLFLDHVLRATPEQIRFDTVLSEEGGRFYHARNRYMIVETDLDASPEELADFRWMPIHQLVGLLRHSHYVNVQARSLVACLHSLPAAS